MDELVLHAVDGETKKLAIFHGKEAYDVLRTASVQGDQVLLSYKGQTYQMSKNAYVSTLQKRKEALERNANVTRSLG